MEILPQTMEKPGCTAVCPVCFLYLREGITLKTHLQTHSKEKVIEALLKQDSLQASTTSDEHLELSSSSQSSNTITVPENSSFSTVNRGTITLLPSTSFVSSNNHNNQPLSIDNQAVQNVNNVQFPSNVNNVISQTTVGNMCNANLTYQTFITNDGNILLVPVYNMCSPSSVMVPNNVVPTSVVNPCMVVSQPNSDPFNVLSGTSISKFNSNASQSVCVQESQQNDDLSFSNNTVYELLDESNEHDDEKETNDEVANILKPASSCDDLSKEDEEVKSPRFSKKSKVRLHSKTGPDDSVELEKLEIQKSETEKMDEVEVRDSLLVTNTINSSPIPSTSTDVENTDSMESVKSCYSMDKSEESEIGPRSCSTTSEVEIDCIPSMGTSESILLSTKEENTSDASKEESECYMQPNNEEPDNSSLPSHSNFGIFALCKNALLPNSVPVVENSPNAAVPVFPFFTHKYFSDKLCEVDPYAESPDLAKNRIKKSDNGEDFRVNMGSSSSSMTSPFNIQTDESMPARGELSEQESLSSTENTLWELQAQQSTCIQHFNISQNNAETDISIGFHSLITNINMSTSVASGMDEIVAGDSKSLVSSVLRNKVVREFHCFYCKKTFDTWKLRQTHIAEEHADEDSLTIENLFGKRLKFLSENNDVKEEDVKILPTETGDVTMVPVETDDTTLCRLCSATFKTSWLFIRHLREIHGIRKRSCVCPTCFERFECTEDYQEHIEKVHPYECMTCGKKFHTRPGYMLHQKRHMKIKPYSCDVCDKSFVTKQKLTEHFNIHTGNNPIKCEFCDSQFKRYSNYQQHKKYMHMNGKRKLKDFICDCGEVFHSKTKLMWHQEIHDEKPKQCPFCVERFVHASSLTRHIRKWHNESYISEWVSKRNVKNVPCPICNVAYLHTSLQTHLKIHEDVKPYSCGECSKSFRTKWNLQLHKWVHMSRSSKPYKCKICVKAYIHKTDYDAHLRSHNNCRPYSCNVCGRQFIRKYNCLRHMREHVEPRAFKCEVCGKMFSRSYYLSEHLKVHTGLKPHICHFCGKASATKSNHNKHVKMHTMARETINSES